MIYYYTDYLSLTKKFLEKYNITIIDERNTILGRRIMTTDIKECLFNLAYQAFSFIHSPVLVDGYSLELHGKPFPGASFRLWNNFVTLSDIAEMVYTEEIKWIYAVVYFDGFNIEYFYEKTHGVLKTDHLNLKYNDNYSRIDSILYPLNIEMNEYTKIPLELMYDDEYNKYSIEERVIEQLNTYFENNKIIYPIKPHAPKKTYKSPLLKKRNYITTLEPIIEIDEIKQQAQNETSYKNLRKLWNKIPPKVYNHSNINTTNSTLQ
jgi:hypothetical protein